MWHRAGYSRLTVTFIRFHLLREPGYGSIAAAVRLGAGPARPARPGDGDDDGNGVDREGVAEPAGKVAAGAGGPVAAGPGGPAGEERVEPLAVGRGRPAGEGTGDGTAARGRDGAGAGSDRAEPAG